MLTSNSQYRIDRGEWTKDDLNSRVMIAVVLGTRRSSTVKRLVLTLVVTLMILLSSCTKQPSAFVG